ncbi:hypothetical protein IE81DRAFT_342607 [Ceraceosorus guamensis]|uniref:Uncharacterized protein n=1 Tax=Ceraceosorus guamensis TaxID=1522189 RepID=A0A316VT35_9BASI|nr:hypothetical protein IE81DRAFT_342607 [Ceraceosorus guamensis]PWN40652.1 hypothetical protein IE81DRAFT_342607 [Ceraceosorus guamensis]
MNRSLRLADLGKLSVTPVASRGGKLVQSRSPASSPSRPSSRPIHCIWARFLLSLALLAVYIGSCIAQPIQEMSSSSSDATTMQQVEAVQLGDLLRTFKLQLADVKASNPDWASDVRVNAKLKEQSVPTSSALGKTARSTGTIVQTRISNNKTSGKSAECQDITALAPYDKNGRGCCPPVTHDSDCCWNAKGSGTFCGSITRRGERLRREFTPDEA